MLSIDTIDVFYGELQAIWGVSLEVNEGEIVALVGPNGAGKTTILNTISGLYKPASGEIRFLGKLLGKEPPNKIVELGISQVPESGKVFTGMSVFENLELGAFVPKARKVKGESIERVYEIFPRLAERQKQLAPILVEYMFEMVERINQMGVTILLVEQNIQAALNLAHRAYLLENGRIVGQGSVTDLLSFESVRSSYLG
jgi:branched-chain amino acid transport system ATP-binding protein